MLQRNIDSSRPLPIIIARGKHCEIVCWLMSFSTRRCVSIRQMHFPMNVVTFDFETVFAEALTRYLIVYQCSLVSRGNFAVARIFMTPKYRICLMEIVVIKQRNSSRISFSVLSAPEMCFICSYFSVVSLIVVNNEVAILNMNACMNLRLVSVSRFCRGLKIKAEHI